MQREAYDLARVYLEAEEAEIVAGLTAAAEAAQAETNAAAGARNGAILDTAAAHAMQLGEALQGELRLQIERDVLIMRGALRTMTLTQTLRASPGAAGRGRRGHAAETREGALSALAFEFTDRAGKRWPSPRHVRVLWRHALVLAWNESALLAGAAIGLDAMEIAHPDPRHGGYGQKIAVAAQGDGMTWQEARGEGYFHPQSNAWLRPISQS